MTGGVAALEGASVAVGGADRDVPQQHFGPREALFVGWLLNVPATCECISGTDLHRQFYVLPH